MAEQDFELAVKYVQLPPIDGHPKPSSEKKLELYKYFKQATVGPCNITKPGILEVEARSKMEAWTSVKDLSKEEAKLKYIECLARLDPSWKENAKKLCK